jgi:AcrR family transcriptional regulator
VERSSGTIRNAIPVKLEETSPTGGEGTSPTGGRRPRADARRNADALLDAAKTVFATSGVDAPPKEIANAAGVGIGTLYRHFPRRADLVVAVFRREIDACADAAPVLAGENPPGVALEKWLYRLTEFVATKRGLAAALHSGDAAFDDLPALFMGRFVPALEALLTAATVSGDVRATISAEELIRAVAQLCHSTVAASSVDQSRRLVSILAAGLRQPSPKLKG